MQATNFLTVRGGYVYHCSSSFHPTVTGYSPLRRHYNVALRSSSTVRTSVFISNHCSQGKPMDDHEYMKEALKWMTLSPLNTEYAKEVEELLYVFSKHSFFLRYLMIVQVEWLLKLSNSGKLKEVPKFSPDGRAFLEKIINEFKNAPKLMPDGSVLLENLINQSLDDKSITEVVEKIYKDKFKNQSEISKVLQNYQFMFTREVINLACGMMLKDGIDSVMFPVMTNIRETLSAIAHKKKEEMPAQPSTLEEELPFPADELNKLTECVHISVQFTGRGGNYNSKMDWSRICKEFVTSLDLEFDPNIDLKDQIKALHDNFLKFNIKLCEKLQSYISADYFNLKKGEEFETSKNNLRELVSDSLKAHSERESTNPVVVDLVGLLEKSLVMYKGILQELNKLKLCLVSTKY